MYVVQGNVVTPEEERRQRRIGHNSNGMKPRTTKMATIFNGLVASCRVKTKRLTSSIHNDVICSSTMKSSIHPKLFLPLTYNEPSVRFGLSYTRLGSLDPIGVDSKVGMQKTCAKFSGQAACLLADELIDGTLPTLYLGRQSWAEMFAYN